MTVKSKTELSDQLNNLIQTRLDRISLPQKPRLAYSPFRYVLNIGGKRIRPYCVLLGCGICNGNVNEAISGALALELLHNFTLVHDDIMDKAETRRGKSSVHAKWNPSTAILTGDIIFSKAFQQLQYYGESDLYDKNTYRRIQDCFLKAVDTVCEGQALDLEFAGREEVKLNEYLEMIEKKTAYLIGTSLSLGGLIAGATQNHRKILFEIGRKAGIAFQIQDDLLDVIGNPDKFGKEVGGDIKEGKKTYLSILAAQRVDEKNKKSIYKVLCGEDVNDADIDKVIKIYENHDVIDDTSRVIQKYYNQTIELFNNFPENQYKTVLKDLINQLSQRER